MLLTRRCSLHCELLHRKAVTLGDAKKAEEKGLDKDLPEGGAYERVEKNFVCAVLQ